MAMNLNRMIFFLSGLWWKEINTNLVQTNDNIAEVYHSGRASGSNAKWKCKLEHSQRYPQLKTR